MKKIKSFLAYLTLFFIPLLVSANNHILGPFPPGSTGGNDAAGVTGRISSFVTGLNGIINALIAFFIGVAVIVFIYGVIKYVLSAENEEKRTDAKWYMIYGIIGIFVTVSIFGLVQVLQNTFLGPGGGTGVSLPSIGG